MRCGRGRAAEASGESMTTSPFPDFVHEALLDPARQSRIGLALASAIIAAWAALHIGLVFWFQVGQQTLPFVLPFVVFQTWLYVGLFIIAHDCMHGSLVPFKPAANRLIGRICLLLYAGFSFGQLNRAHHRHHRHSGTADDPDFDVRPPHGFWPWFFKFFFEYFSVVQVALISAGCAFEMFVLGASPINIIVFWAIPGLLSAVQLFTFGTYLPHRPEVAPFRDRHNARTNDFPIWMSLITCFHFGFHHEHHLYPTVPWWRLPAIRARSTKT